MNGELAQLVALAVHGSAWLSRGTGDPPTFAGSSTFLFVRSVTFDWRGSGDRRSNRADRPADWLRQFQGRGGRLLLVTRQRPLTAAGVASYNLAGFANGGSWALYGVAGGGGELWTARWSVDPEISSGRKPRPADNRIWDIGYEGIGTMVRGPDAMSLGQTEERLKRSVAAAREFAEVEGWTSWAEWLGKALEMAESENARQPYHQDLLLASTPLEVARLLASASQAWVFGGMGWWNDQGPTVHDTRAFDEVTEALYEAVLDAIVEAANAAARSAQQHGTT